MNAQREIKEKKVADLQKKLSTAKIMVLTHYSGNSVEALTNLRTQLAANGGSFQITKNTLALLAMKGTPAEVLKELFKGPTAIAISDDENQISQIPKTIVDFGKENENLKILGGAMDGALLNEGQVRELANLPSMNSLRSMLIGLITMPASKLITLFNQPGSQLARILVAKAEAQD